MLHFYIKSLNPRGHIEACSYISYFLAEVISSEIYEKGGSFYGIFEVLGSIELFELLSDIADDLTIELPAEKTLR